MGCVSAHYTTAATTESDDAVILLDLSLIQEITSTMLQQVAQEFVPVQTYWVQSACALWRVQEHPALHPSPVVAWLRLVLTRKAITLVFRKISDSLTSIPIRWAARRIRGRGDGRRTCRSSTPTPPFPRPTYTGVPTCPLRPRERVLRKGRECMRTSQD